MINLNNLFASAILPISSNRGEGILSDGVSQEYDDHDR